METALARRRACGRSCRICEQIQKLCVEGTHLEGCSKGLTVYALPSWKMACRVQIDDKEVLWSTDALEKLGLKVGEGNICKLQGSPSRI